MRLLILCLNRWYMVASWATCSLAARAHMWSSTKETQRKEVGTTRKRKTQKRGGGGEIVEFRGGSMPDICVMDRRMQKNKEQSKMKKQQKATCWNGAEETREIKRTMRQSKRKKRHRGMSKASTNLRRKNINLSAQFVQGPSWPHPLEALSGPSSGPRRLTPPQNCHCSSCGAVHGMLLPVPNRQGWPPWGQPHPMPAVQPPAQPFILYIHAVTIYTHTCVYKSCVHIPYM